MVPGVVEPAGRMLLVEDDAFTVELVRRACDLADVALELEVVKRGEEALDALKATASEGRLPNLVLLDLRPMGMNGVDVLRAVRADPDLRTCRVVVYTGSVLASDEAAAWDAGADDFFVKPDRFNELVERMRGLVVPPATA